MADALPGTRAAGRQERNSVRDEQPGTSEELDVSEGGVGIDEADANPVDASARPGLAEPGGAETPAPGGTGPHSAIAQGSTSEAGRSLPEDQTEILVTDTTGERRTVDQSTRGTRASEGVLPAPRGQEASGLAKATDERSNSAALEQTPRQWVEPRAESSVAPQEGRTALTNLSCAEGDAAEGVPESRVSSLNARESVDGGAKVEVADSPLFREAILSFTPAYRVGHHPAGILAGGGLIPWAATTVPNEGRLPGYSEGIGLRTAQLTKTVGAGGWSDELGQRLLWQVHQQRQSAELRLNPPELGSLTILIKQEDDTASVSFVVESSSTRAAVEGALPRLRELFGEAGLALSDVQVTERQAEQHHNTRSDSGAQQDSAPDEEGAEVDDSGAQARVASGLLDAYV
ncbi:flagellar hook-length control protein [Thioflavicoccus mobilis 8321]|uniref:Flagellar hook-length control protein n=1 Tax=Thioflavicoccus mobilis 8321 TaxID=765912 RepID=L0GUU8_9GAMM|nr:flagellar hook-length control protein [Thioflavicoccus mobilis 8321]